LADNDDIDYSDAGFHQRTQKYRGAIGSAADAADTGSWFDLGDIAAAPFRGVVDAAHGVYGLANTLTGDALPDWENPLGHSHTFIGSSLEGIAQFSAGFIPFGGIGGFAGLLPELAEGAGLAATVGRAAAGAGLTAFTAFGGHDKRLSDLVESVPALRNPVTAFLKSDENDPELWGRLKNGLEQAGLAAAIEPLFYALKAFKAKRAAAGATDATPEAVEAAGNEHVQGIRQGLDNMDAGRPPKDPAAQGPTSPDGVTPSAQNGTAIADLPKPDAAQPPGVDPLAPAEPSTSPEATKPWEMSPEQLRAMRSAAEGDDAALLKDLFGEDGAKKYQQLSRAENSSNADKARAASAAKSDMEDALSQAQQDRLFGRGESKLSPEDWNEYQTALGNVDTDSPEAMAKSLRKPLTEVGQLTDPDPSKMTRQQQVSYAAVRYALGVAKENGWDPKEILSAGLKNAVTQFRDPEDAVFMFKGFLSGSEGSPDAAAAGAVKEPALLTEGSQASPAANVEPSASQAAQEASNQPPPIAEPDANATPVTPKAKAARALEKLGKTPVQIGELLDTMGRKEELAPHLFNPEGAEFGPNPRALSRTDQALAGIFSGDTPMTSFRNATGVPALMSATSEAILPAVMKDLEGLQPRTIAEIQKESLSALADITGSDPARLKDQITRGLFGGDGQQGDLEALAKPLARARAYRTLLDVTGRENVQHLDFVQKLFDGADGVKGNLDLELVKADYNMRYFSALQLGVQGMYSMIGRALRGAQDLTEGLSMGDFLARAAGEGGMVNKLPEFDAALASQPKALAAQVNALGGREFLMDQLGKMRAAYGEGNTAALAKMARMSTGARIAAMTREFWLSALLGSPKTLLVNVLSQTGNSVYGPYEKMLGAQLVKGYNGIRGRAIEAAAQDPVIRAAQDQAGQLMHALPDMLQLGKASASGENIALRGDANAVLDPHLRAPALSSQNLGMDPNSVGGKIVDFMANLVRMPVKILGESDKVISQVNARTYAKSWLREEALSKGITEPAAQSEYIASEMSRIVDGNQFKTLAGVTEQMYSEAKASGLTNPQAIDDYAAKRIAEVFPEDRQDLVERSIAYARDRNFTTPAEPGTLSWSLQRMVAQHPYLSAIMPFINTPINLLKWTGQRLDAYGLASYMVGRKQTFFESPELVKGELVEATKNRFLKEMLSGDPEQKANAVGRLATGAGLATLAMTAAYNGIITGRGPQDPKERQAWLAAGNLPYAVKTSAGHVQFSRLDPVATMFSTAADIMDTIRHGQQEDQPAVTSLVHALGIAFANNITQKSYLTGIQKITEVLTDPDKNMAKYLQSAAGSFVPNTLNAAVGPVGDDYTREIGGMVDAVQARLPGLSQSLPPQRNILGEPIERTTAAGSGLTRWADFILPVAFKATSDDVVTGELARLAYPFSPLSKTVNGQDLTQVPHGQTNAFDRWGELVGTTRIRGLTIRDSLRKLIMSKEYQRLEPDIVDKTLSPRAELINRTVHDYRAQAFEQVLKENPKLQAFTRTFTQNRQALRHGLQPSILPVVTE